MLFCSQQFLLFFLCVFAVYWLTPWRRGRVWILLVASFAFYTTWNHWLAGLVCVTTTADFFIAKLMERSEAPGRRKILLSFSVAANLGMLAYFKYANFFLASLEEALRAVGASASFPVLSIFLPLGISFYTFEAISYTVDVYRRKIPAEKDLAEFMLFILFFPHLIGGPIVRARDFLPQIQRPKRWNWARLNLGLQLFLLGAFKKIVIADRLALIVDPVFAEYSRYSTETLWMATLAWAIQVYCDFSGYTDMAIGCAHALGYKLSPNFNMPYIAKNIADLWRRWHISLSSWLRDYLFIPLGGSRGSRWKTARNLFTVMVVAGLWHGADWPYIVFGVVHGVLLSIHMLFRNFCRTRPLLDQWLNTSLGTGLRIALTFTTFCLTIVIFRAHTLAAGFGMLKAMFTPLSGAGLPLSATTLWLTVAVVVLSHVVGWSGILKRSANRIPTPLIGLAQAAGVSVVLVLAVGGGRSFVYFQF